MVSNAAMTAARILVVEDEWIVAQHLREQLLKLGYDVPAPIASGTAALEQFEELKPDLILMDIHVAGKLDGIETAAAIAARYHKPVIYLTGYAEPAILERARATKPYGYLLKPFSWHDGEAALHQAHKIEAIGQLASSMAHDFNNLLGVIIGNLDRMAERELPDAELSEMVQETLRAAVRGAGLTRQLLAYSHRPALEPRVLDLGRTISDLVGKLRRTLGETIELRTPVPGNPALAQLDLGQFENALLNLAVNARDAMPGGGMFTIDGRTVEVMDSDGGLPAGKYVLIAVSDTGAGMTMEVAERAFEPFFTTKPAGAGLGLSMVYRFVKQSEGHIRIDSEPGRGTTIKLYFPAAIIVADAIRPALPMAKAGETVLVVEDDAALRKLTAGLLASLGYAVIETIDAPAALQCLDGRRRIDLLLTDIVLPKGMGGPDLAAAARASRPGLKTLFMSGYTEDAAVPAGTIGDGTPLLTKPFRKADLAHRVRLLLDGKAPA